jgi:hypothetical protein
MKWLMQFYNSRRGIPARYGVEAALPAEAVLLGWKAGRAEHPSTPRRSRLSLFELAERIGGQDASGWVLYRIGKDSEPVGPAFCRRTRASCPTGRTRDIRSSRSVSSQSL